MAYEVVGLGNALMDALVVLDDDSLIDELGLVRGTMHPVDHGRWQQIYEQVRRHDVVFDSGGSCANTIATLGRLGARALYCGQVGDDQMGRLYASLIERACGGHALRFSPTQQTGKCLSIISRSDAERTMVTDLGAAVGLSELGPFKRTMTEAKFAHFTGYTLLDGPMQQVVLEGMHAAHAAGTLVSLDAADPFVVVKTKPLLMTLLDDYVSVVFLNAEEAHGLTGLAPHAAAVAIGARGAVETVIVKCGARGSLVWNGGELYEVPIKRVNAVDTTGAGDAYAGGYLYGLTRGWPAPRCGALATRVAGLAVAQVGAVVKDRAALSQALVEVGEQPLSD
ncbi:MAG: sugar/nucleoside kinase (ribokinase family) [Myxococcota bacterium]|jgi:sugar/nucleoside kinase (ribokinase family)